MPPGLPFLRTQLPLERLERRLRVLEVQAHVRLPPVVPPHDVVDVPEDRTSVAPPPPEGPLDRPDHPLDLPARLRMFHPPVDVRDADPAVPRELPQAAVEGPDGLVRLLRELRPVVREELAREPVRLPRSDERVPRERRGRSPRDPVSHDEPGGVVQDHEQVGAGPQDGVVHLPQGVREPPLEPDPRPALLLPRFVPHASRLLQDPPDAVVGYVDSAVPLDRPLERDGVQPLLVLRLQDERPLLLGDRPGRTSDAGHARERLPRQEPTPELPDPPVRHPVRPRERVDRRLPPWRRGPTREFHGLFPGQRPHVPPSCLRSKELVSGLYISEADDAPDLPLALGGDRNAPDLPVDPGKDEHLHKLLRLQPPEAVLQALTLESEPGPL